MIPSVVNAFPSDGPSKVFSDYLHKGLFMIQRCDHCAQHIFYPRLICPHCGSQKLSWVEASGKGVVYSTSVPRGMPEGDYSIVLIDLQEGPRMMSRVLGIPPENVFIGMQVEATLGEIDQEKLVLFKPVGVSV